MPAPSAINSAEVTAQLAFPHSTCGSGHYLSGSIPRASHCVRIGDISLSLVARGSDDLLLDTGLEAFRIESASADICLDVCWQSDLRARQEPIFDSQALWALFREDGDFVFNFTSPLLGPHPYKCLRIDESFRVGKLVLSREALETYRPVCPLEYPADELLITNYLARHGLGVEVHGCGLIDGETGGHLFLGHSGAGKSTTTRLWQSLRNAEILSDDRIILRLHDGELWMYGTPWHGEAALASPSKAKLNRIFILQHGDENKVTALSPSQAVGELFARSFPPFHSPAGLERSVEFLHGVTKTVPCYEFCFLPEASAIQTVLRFHD
jgi:hypothetical protein